MIEALTFLRLISDYLWEYKAASAIGVLFFITFSATHFLLAEKKLKFTRTDSFFVAFLSLISIAEIANPATNSAIELSKFFAYFVIYIAGRIGPVRLNTPSHLGLFCVFALSVFAAAAFMNIGYQYWGSVATFSGGYFFKTDMAISALILLSIISSTLNSRILLLISTLFSVYIIFKTNSRIALPLTLIIPAFTILTRAGLIQRININALGYLCLIASIGIGLFTLIDFRSLGLMGFDFSDPFSASNTQGRTVIWAALLESYFQADPLRKLIGQGLGADAVATSSFSEAVQLEGVRAHNSYLYLLICTGIIGSILFYGLIFSIARRIRPLLQLGDKQSVIAANLFSTLTLVFLWTSLTTEIIIRAQLMALVFYFSGIVVQRSLIVKKMVVSRCVENTSRS